MSTNTEAVKSLTVIDVEITTAYIDDRSSVPTQGRSYLEFKVTSSTEFKKPTRYLLDFRVAQPEKIRYRDEKYITLIRLDPFMHVKALVPPFELIFDNLGDGQLGCYIRVPGDLAHYSMVIQEEGKQTKEIDEVIELEEEKNLLIVRAVMRPSQIIHIEELVQETPNHAE